jgi:hypothetical protein
METVEYTCAYCGELNETEVDPHVSSRQVYTEDCTVCCRPNVLTVIVGTGGFISISAEFEG